MQKKFYWVIVCAVLFLFPGNSSAITIGLIPDSPQVDIGDKVDVAVTISGLGSFIGPSLGGFDFTLNFDSSILSITDPPVFGDQLDIWSWGMNLQTHDYTPSGSATLVELSFDTSSDLEAFQLDSFTLATLSFEGLAAGVSSLELTAVDLSDASGGLLSHDIQNSQILVRDPVPEPATFFLMAVGLAGLAGAVRKK